MNINNLLMPLIGCAITINFSVAQAASYKPSRQEDRQVQLKIQSAIKWYEHLYDRQAFPWNYYTWTEDDTPYRDARLAIYQAIVLDKIHGSENAKTLVASTLAEVKAHPSDVMAVFRYAYADYYAARISGSDIHGKLITAEIAFDRLPPYHSYEVSRCYFLISEANGGAVNKSMLVGLRVLAHSPHDDTVEDALIDALNPNTFPFDRAVAFYCAGDLIRRHPSAAYVYSNLASLYYKAWESKKRQSDAAGALRYLKGRKAPAFRHGDIRPVSFRRHDTRVITRVIRVSCCQSSLPPEKIGST